MKAVAVRVAVNFSHCHRLLLNTIKKPADALRTAGAGVGLTSAAVDQSGSRGSTPLVDDASVHHGHIHMAFHDFRRINGEEVSIEDDDVREFSGFQCA